MLIPCCDTSLLMNDLTGELMHQQGDDVSPDLHTGTVQVHVCIKPSVRQTHAGSDNGGNSLRNMTCLNAV